VSVVALVAGLVNRAASVGRLLTQVVAIRVLLWGW
jgi:hypothetical protein